MLLEVLLKWFANGIRNYFKSRYNRADFFVTIVIVLCLLARGANYGHDDSATRRLIRGCLLLRILLFPRNFEYLMPSAGFGELGALLRSILRKIYTVSVTFFTIGYAFACFGVSIFGGTICKGPTCNRISSLEASEYGQNDFYALNFNDIVSGIVTLISCLHVSDFDVIADGFVAVTSDYAKIFFAVWYCIGVLLLLNVVKSFFLSGFLSKISGRFKAKPKKNLASDRMSGSMLEKDARFLTVSSDQLTTDSALTEALRDSEASQVEEQLGSDVFLLDLRTFKPKGTSALFG